MTIHAEVRVSSVTSENLIATAWAALTAGKQFVVCSPSPRVKQLLEMS